MGFVDIGHRRLQRLRAGAAVAGLLVVSAVAQPVDPPDPARPAAERAAAAADLADTTLFLGNRKVLSFRATLLGDTPQQRAELGRLAVEAALAKGAGGVVTTSSAGDSVRFAVDGSTVFFLVAGDLAGARPGPVLDVAAQDVGRRLQLAVHEQQEIGDPRRLAIGAAYAGAATLLGYLLLRGLFVLRRKAAARLRARLQDWQGRHGDKGVVTTYAEHVRSAAQIAGTAVGWGLALLLLDVWATFVLRQFAYTRPWGERSTAWLLGVFEQFALATAGAVPGLLIAVLIFLFARLAIQSNTLFMQRVERGDFGFGWLDADTAAPTRRLGNLVIGLFALVMAYPYLPGAGSEAFKGVTVLAGLMLSLGASSVVGQALSVLSLMYSRTLRVGEYVRIGDNEGTVTSIGMFVSKLQTGMGEEVSLPSAVIASQAVRNFSRLVPDGRFVLHTAVTIGYATPWRQVHQMLLEAARRTPGVAADPAPFVVQTALSDFYVEYRLCAQCDNSAPSRRAEAMNQLHGHIQDVFNQNGVQIMSPHYMADPAEPQVVPPGSWPPPARPGETRG